MELELIEDEEPRKARAPKIVVSDDVDEET
jgi:hypothetical protein